MQEITPSGSGFGVEVTWGQMLTGSLLCCMTLGRRQPPQLYFYVWGKREGSLKGYLLS